MVECLWCVFEVFGDVFEIGDLFGLDLFGEFGDCFFCVVYVVEYQEVFYMCVLDDELYVVFWFLYFGCVVVCGDCVVQCDVSVECQVGQSVIECFVVDVVEVDVDVFWVEFVDFCVYVV